MAGKVYWEFQDAFGGVEEVYEKGQPLKTTVARLKEHFPSKSTDEALLLEGIRHFFPDYTITAQDKAERASRRETSALARENYFALLHETLSVREGIPEGATMDRTLAVLFDFGGGPGAKEHNEKVCNLFAKVNGKYINGTPEERGDVIKEFVDSQLSIDFDRLYRMSDRELAGSYRQLHSLGLLAAEGGDALLGLAGGGDIKMPEGCAERLKELKWQHQTQLSDLRNRFGHIIDPSYEIFHYERMRPGLTVNLDEFDDGELTELSERIDGNSHAKNFFGMLKNQNAFHEAACLDKINQAIRKLNLPEESLNPPVYKNGTRVAGPLLDISSPDGTPLSVEELQSGQIVCFTNPFDGQRHFLMSDGINIKDIDFSSVPEPLKTEPEKIIKALEDADPWYIRNFTGSQFYKDMKQSMKDVKALMDQLYYGISDEQSKELKDKLAELSELGTRYLESKDDLTPQTKDSERARIEAGRRVEKFIQDATLLVEGYEQAQKAKEQQRTNQNNNMENNLDAEYAFSGRRGLVDNVYRKEKTGEEMELELRSLNRLMMNTYMSVNLKDGDPLKKLGRSIFTDIDKELYVKPTQDGVYPPLSTQKYSLLNAPEDIALANILQWKTIRDLSGLSNVPDKPVSAQKDLQNMLSRMVAFDLVMRERAMMPKGEIGALETRFRELGADKFSAGIGQSKAVQNLAASMNSRELRGFVGRAAGKSGIQQLTDQVMKEYQTMQPQNGPKEMQPQMQQGIQHPAQGAPQPPKAGPLF